MADGIQFASKKEAARYQELVLLERAGQIADLVVQPAFPLRVNGALIATYYGDFGYTEVCTGKSVFEDVKSEATRKNPVYRLKKKLVKALYGVDIIET